MEINNKKVGMILSIALAICMVLPVTAAMTTSYEPTIQNRGYYLIELDGPMTIEMANSLESRDIEIITHLDGNVYEARMAEPQDSLLSQIPFMKSIQAYPAEMKISPNITDREVIISILESETMGSSILEARKHMNIKQEGPTNPGYIIKGTLRDIDLLGTISEIPDVHFIEPYFPETLHGEIGSQILGGGMWYYDDDANVNTPYRALGSYGSYVNQLGWYGAGVRIAIADTGVGDGTVGDAGHNDLQNRVVGGYDFGTGGWLDQHGHGTHCIGLAAGDTYNGNGVTYAGFGNYYVAQGQASQATIYAEQIFEGASASWVGPADYRDILYENGGSQIHTNSWGANTGGAYSAADEAFDQAIRDSDPGTAGNQPIVTFTSAGNAGSSLNTIGSPGNSKNIITVGGVENYAPDASSYGNTYSTVADNPDVMYTSSSRGWTDDGRIKPDILTPGVNTLSLRSPSELTNNLFGFYSPDTRYQWCTGTSQSCPQAAGGGAVVYGWYDATYGTAPTPATVKALLINTAVDIGTADIPNQNEGWGRMNIMRIIDSPVPFIIHQDPTELTTGVMDTYTFSYADPTEPVKITLAYTDRYSLTGSNPTLQNQVNLEVVTPLGTTYHGNAFSGGWSTTGNPIATFDTNGDGYDDRNNVECVYFPPGALQAGQYTVRVIGTNVPADCDFDGSNDQDYSIVMYNAEDVSSEGTVNIENDMYPAEASVLIEVADTDLNTNTNVQTTTITVTSPTEPSGESVLLTETGGDTSRFQGYLTISKTNGGGVLQVSHNDIITATYNDADDGTGSPQVVTDTALIDGSVGSTSGLTVEWWAPATSSSETRYMRSEGTTVNGLAADGLQTTQGTAAQSFTLTNGNTIYAGIRVWSRSSGGTETEITSGTPIAIASTSSTGSIVSATWSCPETSIAMTDSIVVRLYGGSTSPPATLVQAFTTEVLGASQIDGVTWTCYYFLDERASSDRVYWGTNTYNTRIENFAWSALSNPLDHNTLNWTLSSDDGAGANDVDHYNIYRADNAAGPWTAGAIIDTVPAGTDTYTDVDRGQSDGVQWWYVVRAVDLVANEDTNTNAVPEPGFVPPTYYDIDMSGYSSGDWAFISFPIDVSGNILAVLNDATHGDGQTTWDVIKWYNANDASDPWKTYRVGVSTNDLATIDNKMGVWVHLMANGGDQALTVAVTGDYSASPVAINLYAGWNMVSYPSATSRLASNTLPGATDMVAYYNGAAAYLITDAAKNAVTFSEGNAYWVHSTADVVWTVNT